MATRTVKLALIAYKSEDEGPQYGMLGDEVEVHADDLKRFDKLNNQHGGSDPVPAEVSDEPIAQPSLDDDEEVLERPSTKAHLGDWQDYAEQEGVEIEHADGKAKTKAELIAELSD